MFIETFPIESIMAYRFTFVEDKFNGWFVDNNSSKIIGYVTVSVNEKDENPIKDCISHDGKDYFLIANDFSEFRVYGDDKNYEIHLTDLEKIKAGKRCYIGNHYILNPEGV